MEVFTLIVDEKVSVWRRSRITIEAESMEEAVKDCIQNGTLNAVDFIDSEYLNETEEYIKPDDFYNPVTIEVMDENYKTLGTDESSGR